MKLNETEFNTIIDSIHQITAHLCLTNHKTVTEYVQ